MNFDNINNSSARTMGNEFEARITNTYFGEMNPYKIIDHPIICKRCKGDLFNYIRRKNTYKYVCRCFNCKAEKVITFKPGEVLHEQKIS